MPGWARRLTVSAQGQGSSNGAVDAAAQQSFLSFDFGTRRVGVACGSRLLGCAQALGTVAAEGDARFDAIKALINEWRPDALVVGVPLHPDGEAHENTRRAQRFARQLHGRFGLPVHEVDERWTTTEALSQAHAPGKQAGRGGRSAGDIDAASAALILDQFLRSLEPHDAAA